MRRFDWGPSAWVVPTRAPKILKAGTIYAVYRAPSVCYCSARMIVVLISKNRDPAWVPRMSLTLPGQLGRCDGRGVRRRDSRVLRRARGQPRERGRTSRATQARGVACKDS